MNGFLTKDSNRTGRAGILTNIGQDKDLTVFRIINLAMYRDSLSRELSSRNALSPEESTKRGREESIKGRAQEAQE